MALESSFKQEMEGTEKEKKSKKLRSIKFPKGSKTQQETTRFEWPSPDLSSNNSSPKKESSQEESESEESSDSSSSSGSTASTESSNKKRGSELKKTLKKSRSRKLTTLGSFRSSRRRAKSRFDQSSVVGRENAEVISQQYPTSIEVSDASPIHYSQASPQHSESSFGSCDNGKTSSQNSQLQKFSRTSSLRTKRIFKKNKTSFKPKKPSKEKHFEISLDPSLERATCSSTLKDSKFPKQLELQPGKDESEKIAVMKVCPYHHCSLHGHHHHDAPDQDPPKRFEYLKRRSGKTQGTESQSATAVKRSGKRREEVKSRQMLFDGASATREEASGRKAMSVVRDREDFSIEFYAKTRSEPVLGAIEENEDADLADILFGVKSFQGSLNDNRDTFSEGRDMQETYTELEATSLGNCCDAKKLEESSSEAVYKDLEACSRKGDDKISTTEEKIPNTNMELRVDELSNITKGSTGNVFGGAEEEANPTSSASNLHPTDESGATMEERSRDFNPDRELVDGSTQRDSETNGLPAVGHSEVSAVGHEANKSQVKKVNRLSMWYMIHRQMVSGLAAEVGTKPLQQADGEEQVRKDDANKLPERKDFGAQTSFSDSDMDTESQDQASQEIEIRKMFAIKLVREAIEKILLPEVKDDQSITSDVTSEQDLSENNHGEGGEELSISTHSIESDSINNTSGNEEEKAAVKVGKKSESKAPKRWSYLKKVILLNKFIKELEKVKKFNPKKPQHLPLEPEPEAETVSLRLQMIGGKKNSEEWMLDFALRQVVSELAPTQKRKVALLVKAFETVAPSQEEQQIKVTVPRLRGSTRKGSSQKLSLDSNEQEVHDRVIPCSSAELNKGGSEFTGVDREQKATRHVSSSVSDQVEQLTTATEEKNRESKQEGIFVQEIPSPSGSKLDIRARGAQGTDLDKKKQLKMWHMIYQHVVTDIAEKVGTQLLLDGADGNEVDDEKKSGVKASKSNHEFSTTNPSDSRENHDVSGHRLEFSRSDAVKLVQEAVDEILLPEVQDDSSDTQSVASDISPDPELLNKVEGGISSSQEEKESAVDHIQKPEAERPALTLKNKFDPQKSKNWSKLKKLILLKRSIRALEQVRKLNPRPPQQLPLTSDPEGDKFDLRRQMMDERKKAEEWMLDYAVQHIVTTLTPARKKRVAMLVEAFEAVVPLPEI